MGFHFVLIFLCCIIIKPIVTERLHGQIYSSIEGGAACFRRLNGTHQAGCSSSNKGGIGVVHMVKEVSDAQWLVLNGSAGPYMAVVSTAQFHNVVGLLMDNSHKVAGILLYENATEKTNSFSQESTCPNEYSSGPGSQCSAQAKKVWNTVGTGLIRQDIPFPIFYLPAARLEEIDKIQKCYERYNLDLEAQVGKPLCSIQLNSFMWAAVNSIVCRRRSAANALLTATKVCDPLGDSNVYYSLFPRDKGSQTKKKVVLVTARIDTASLFDGIAPGAASSVVGMVTLITAATTLSKIIPATDASKYGKNVLWTLLNGEAFDYIGSQRVAFDLARGTWPPDAPLAPSDISLHVEIGQIGGSLASLKDATWPLYAYAPTDLSTLENISEFIEELSVYLKKYEMGVLQAFSNNLPPSSLHSFRRLRNGTELPELLLADHDGPFTNMFYNSAMDDYQKIDYKYRNITVGTDGTFVPTEELINGGNMTTRDPQVKVARVATAVAHALYQQVTGKPYAGDISASAHMVDELLYCFLEDKMCKLLTAAELGQAPLNSAGEEPRAAPLYVGVATWATNAATLAGHALALLAGQHRDFNKTVCEAASIYNFSPDYSYYWLRGWNHSGVCVETNMNFSEAISPAFIVPDYDFTSGEYSTWTESVWQAMWARVFVSAGGGGAAGALAAGTVATILTAALTYWLQANVNRVFVNAPHPSVHSNDAVPGILRTVNC